MINDKQNFEDQYFHKFGFPMMVCNSHQNDFYECINLNNKNHNKLACAQCIIKDKLNPEFLISIKDIFSKNPNNIIQNWPPLQDQNIYQQLASHSLQENKKIQLFQQINKYFDELQVDILKIIDGHQKKILMHINSIKENSERVIDVYNEISSKDEIKNVFLKNTNNSSQQIEQYLKETILKKQAQSQVNEQNIKNTLDIFTKSQQQFQFEYIESVCKQILIDLKQIDFLNPLLANEQQMQLKISEKKKDQDEKIVQTLKVIEKKEGNENKNEINDIDLLQSLKIIKSNYDSPHLISLKKIENNYFLIEKYCNCNDWSQVIIDEELKREKKYQIQIDIKYQNLNNITVGLLPISQKDQAGWQSKLSLDLFRGGDGIDLIERGNHISKLYGIEEISIQICLKEKILRFLSVVDNVKNINSLDDWNKIKPNEKYYFYIALGKGYYKIEMNEFKIIKQFDYGDKYQQLFQLFDQIIFFVIFNIIFVVFQLFNELL